jgi:basic endochitinase B
VLLLTATTARTSPTTHTQTTTVNPAPTPAPVTTPAQPTAPSGGGGSIGQYYTQADFTAMFPMITPGTSAYNTACTGAGFFTYAAFVEAAAAFSAFATTGTPTENKREIAAFLAQASQETNGAGPGQFNGGLCFVQEGGSTPTTASYCSPSDADPCVAGQSYRGRGPLQVSYNFNYGPAGRALGVDLLSNPGLLATDAVLSFKASLYFWMTPSAPKPSCHDAMRPAFPSDGNRVPGFGWVTNIINGGVLQCGNGNPTRSDAELKKIGYYNQYESVFGLSQSTAANAVNCATQSHY